MKKTLIAVAGAVVFAPYVASSAPATQKSPAAATQPAEDARNRQDLLIGPVSSWEPAGRSKVLGLPHDVKVVQPLRINSTAIEKTTKTIIDLDFMFVGEPDPHRIIRVRASLCGDDGAILDSKSVDTKDQRLAADTTEQSGTLILRQESYNSATFVFKTDLVARASKIQISFEVL